MPGPSTPAYVSGWRCECVCGGVWHVRGVDGMLSWWWAHARLHNIFWYLLAWRQKAGVKGHVSIVPDHVVAECRH